MGDYEAFMVHWAEWEKALKVKRNAPPFWAATPRTQRWSSTPAHTRRFASPKGRHA